jgi:hypothetical protein
MEDVATTGAVSLLHGAGHNSDRKDDHVRGLGYVLRWDGAELAAAVTGRPFLNENKEWIDFGSPPMLGNLNSALNNDEVNGTPRNEGYLAQMKIRFGETTAKDNYQNNSRRWKWIEKIFHVKPQQGRGPNQ